VERQLIHEAKSVSLLPRAGMTSFRSESRF
jgi:hypothetical protein